ncbi:separin-like [Glandiceps talaboti]
MDTCIFKTLKEGHSASAVLKDIQVYLGPFTQKNGKNDVDKKLATFCMKILRQCVHNLTESMGDVDEILQICMTVYECINEVKTNSQLPALALDKLLFHVMVNAVKHSKWQEVCQFGQYLYKEQSQHLTAMSAFTDSIYSDIDVIAKNSFNTLWKASCEMKTKGISETIVLQVRTLAIEFAILSKSELSWVVDQAWKVAVLLIKGNKSNEQKEALDIYFNTVYQRLTDKVQCQNRGNTTNTDDVMMVFKWSVKCVIGLQECYPENAKAMLENSQPILLSLCHSNDKLLQAMKVCIDIIKVGCLLTSTTTSTSTQMSLLLKIQNDLSCVLRSQDVKRDVLQCIILAGDVTRKCVENIYNANIQLSQDICHQLVNFLNLHVEILQMKLQSQNATQQKQEDTNAQLNTLNLACKLMLRVLLGAKSSGDPFKRLCLSVCERAVKVLQETSSQDNEHRTLGVNIYNLAIALYNNEMFSDCIAILHLACQQLCIWCFNGGQVLDNDRQQTVQLLKKYELLVDCQRKSGCPGEAMETVSSAMSVFMEYPDAVHCLVTLWIKAKHDISKQNQQDISVKTQTLKDFVKDLDPTTISMILQLEHQIYKDQSYDTSVEQYGVLCDILSLCDDQEKDQYKRAYYLIQLVKLLHASEMECDCQAQDVCQEAITLLEDYTTNMDDHRLQDLLAVAYVWNYVNQTPVVDGTSDIENDRTLENISINSTVNGDNNDMQCLLQAVQLWSQDYNTDGYYDINDTCQAMMMLAAIFHLKHKDCELVLTLQLLGNTASQAQHHHISTIAYAEASKIWCYLDNQLYGKKLLEKSKNSLERIKTERNNTTRQIVNIMYTIAMCQYMVKCKQFSEVERLLDELSQDNVLELHNRWSYLLKADLKELTANYLLTYGYIQPGIENTAMELMLEALRLRQGVCKLGPTLIDFPNKVQWGVDIWSLRATLLKSLYSVGQLYNQQGCVREAKCYLSEGLVLSNTLALPIRCCEFLLELASGALQGGKIAESENYLENTKTTISPKNTADIETRRQNEDSQEDDDDDFIISKPISMLEDMSDIEENIVGNSPRLVSQHLTWTPIVLSDIRVNRIQLQMAVVYLDYMKVRCKHIPTNLICAIDGFTRDTRKLAKSMMQDIMSTEKQSKKWYTLSYEDVHVNSNAEVDILVCCAEMARNENRLEDAVQYIDQAQMLCALVDSANLQALVHYNKALTLLGKVKESDCQWLHLDMMKTTGTTDDIFHLSKHLNQCHLSLPQADTKHLTTNIEEFKLTTDEIQRLEKFEEHLSGKPKTRRKKVIKDRSFETKQQGTVDIFGFVSSPGTFQSMDSNTKPDVINQMGSEEQPVLTMEKTNCRKTKQVNVQATTVTARELKKGRRKKNAITIATIDAVSHNAVFDIGENDTTEKRRTVKNEKDPATENKKINKKNKDTDTIEISTANRKSGRATKIKTAGKQCDSRSKKAESEDVMNWGDKLCTQNVLNEKKKIPRRRGRRAKSRINEEIETVRSQRDIRIVKNIHEDYEELGISVELSDSESVANSDQCAAKPDTVHYIEDLDSPRYVIHDGDFMITTGNDDIIIDNRDIEIPGCTRTDDVMNGTAKNDDIIIDHTSNEISGYSESDDVILIDPIEVVRSKDTESEDEDVCLSSKPVRRVKKSNRRKVNKEQQKSVVDLQEVIEVLQKAYEMCQNLPPTVLYVKICQLLCWCLGNMTITSSINASFYLNESLAVTLRHHKLITLYKKHRVMKKQNRNYEILRLNKDKQVFIFDGSQDTLQQTMEELPHGWSVCTMSVLYTDNTVDVMINRIQSHQDPIIVKIPLTTGTRQNYGRNLDQIIADFFSILRESKVSVKETNKQIWWTTREDLDDRLEILLSDVENSVLEHWKVLLLGNVDDDKTSEDIARKVTMFHQQHRELALTPWQLQLLQLLVEGNGWLSEHQALQGLSSIIGLAVNTPQLTTIYEDYQKLTKKLEGSYSLKSTHRHPVILILDKNIQHIPWESIPILRGQSVSRMPSLHFVLSHLKQRHYEDSVLNHGIDPTKTFYVINPSNDLPSTQKTFQDWFQSQKGWHGVAGNKPSRQEFKTALLKEDLFIYCGHGTGRQYLHGDDIQQLECKAVSLLIGCSSGKLQVKGQLESTGMVLYYLQAECPCVVGNLWDVTDRDIDRYLEALLKSWLHSDKPSQLLKCVSSCREICKLPYLIGAAPVVYGLPVNLTLSK